LPSAPKELLSIAPLRCILHEVDGASGNDKFHAGTKMLEDRRPIDEQAILEMLHCQNHAHHLITVAMVHHAGCDLLNRMYASSGFLSKDGHWVRLLHAVSKAVKDNLNISYEPPLSGSSEHASRVCEYLQRVEMYTVDVDDDGSSSNRRGEVLRNAVLAFKAVFNGAWWGTAWTHHCRRDGQCCPGSSDRERAENALESATKAIKALLLRKRPSRASANKWNKLLPSFDFYLIGMAAHRILALLVVTAMCPLKVVWDKAHGFFQIC
jgi:hypothetical protein